MHIHNLFTKGFTLVTTLVNMKSLIFYRTFFRAICFIQTSFIFFFIDQNFFCMRVNRHGNTEFKFSVAIMFFHLFSFSYMFFSGNSFLRLFFHIYVFLSFSFYFLFYLVRTSPFCFHFFNLYKKI